MIELDGSFGEGGGQILRTSLTLSLLTGKPFHLRNIRAGRPKPGLQPQHLMSVTAAATISRSAVRGASRGSTDLEFHPGRATAGRYRFDIGTAGATGLVLQTICLPLALHGSGVSEVTLTGGTHVLAAPCFHFLDTTWRAYLEQFGLDMNLRMPRPGFYPRGGGEVQATIQPCPRLRNQTLRTSGPPNATGFAAVAGLPDHIASRMAKRLRHRLEQLYELKVEIQEESWPGGPGAVLAVTLDAPPVPTLLFEVGERGKPAEKVTDDLVHQVGLHLAGAPGVVDSHSADQVLIPLSLAEGPSEYTVTAVTSHLRTNVVVIGKFLEREIVCEAEEGGPGVVRLLREGEPGA